MQAQTRPLFPPAQLYLARYLSESWSVASPLPSLCPLKAYSCIISLRFCVKCVNVRVCEHGCLCVRCVFMYACVCVYACASVCLCVFVGTHPSVTLPQTSGASPLTRAAQSPNLIAHTPLYCTNLNAIEKVCIAFLSPLTHVPFNF